MAAAGAAHPQFRRRPAAANPSSIGTLRRRGEGRAGAAPQVASVRSVNGTLILLNVLAFLLQLQSPDLLLARYALWPVGAHEVAGLGPVVEFAPWQLLSSAFLHGGLSHLLLNMFALWMFGHDCERVLGPRRYLALYFAAVLSASLLQLLVVSLSGAVYPTVGASGGVFGVLLAFGMLFPERRVLLLFPPIPMPAWLLVTLYGVVELANGVLGTQAGVAHFAHLGGMLGAYLVLRRWRGAAR
jgi:membrane associated rhomboid family serine protease